VSNPRNLTFYFFTGDIKSCLLFLFVDCGYHFTNLVKEVANEYKLWGTFEDNSQIHVKFELTIYAKICPKYEVLPHVF